MVLAEAAHGAVRADDLLNRVRTSWPTAKRILLLDWGLRPEQVNGAMRAAALGEIDRFLTKPTGPRRRGLPRRAHRRARRLVLDNDADPSGGTRSRRCRQPPRRGAARDPRAARGADGSALVRVADRDRDGGGGGERRAPSVVEVWGRTVLSDPTDREVAVAFGIEPDLETTSTSRSSAPGRRASPQLSTARRRGCRRWSSKGRPSAVRPERAR